MPYGSAASYPGGGYRTDVSGPAGGGSGASAGDPGGGGGGWLWDIAKRSAQDKLRKSALEEEMMRLQLEESKRAARGARRRPVGEPRGPARLTPAQQQAEIDRARQQSVQSWQNFGRGRRTAAQQAMTMIGGPQAQAYSDMANQMAALQAAGVGVADYTGLTQIAESGAGASGASVGEAGANLRQSREMGGPGIAEAARQSQIMRQYPGLAQRMFIPPQEKG